MNTQLFKKAMPALLGFSFAVAFSACTSVNLRIAPDTPEDEIGFWDNVQRKFGAHACVDSPKDCTPICIKDREELDKKKIENEESWKIFSTMEPYAPKKCGVALVDKANDDLAPLSAQIIEEVVKPYVELDKGGHIVAYHTFLDDVDIRIKQKKEQGVKLSFEDSVKETAVYWYEKYGPEQFQSFLTALPFVERMQAENQITEAIPGLLVAARRILVNVKGDANQFVDTFTGRLTDPDAWVKRAEATEAMLGTAVVCEQLIWGLTFLQALDDEHSDELNNIKTALEGIDTQNL